MKTTSSTQNINSLILTVTQLDGPAFTWDAETHTLHTSTGAVVSRGLSNTEAFLHGAVSACAHLLGR